MGDDTSVRVALRVRPQIPREIIDMCRVCTSVAAGDPQVWLGSDKAFTFDYVFDMNGTQEEIYNTCVHDLIEGCYEGFNATVLAYGQTGSGKTYTMGTGFDMNSNSEELGIIPRAVDHLFRGIEERQQQAVANNEQPPEFKVVCQFMELYNEEVIDLFDTARDGYTRGKKSSIKIHEDSTGAICAIGLTSRVVTSKHETMQCLKLGALSRTTASTQMNVQSSRSHAVFTLHIKQQRVLKCKDLDGETNDLNELETLTAKFHFVDLAGSERLKRTGATGERAKEGISINCGLLALGNVISALGDDRKRGSHVPYRDSKLTRLLQDSLGGNSRTVMIACISPSDRDFMETLNTLKYANRARNIKNRITVNQDKTTKTIATLRMEIQQLQLELMEYKQLMVESHMITSSICETALPSIKVTDGDGEYSGKRMVVDGVESINDMYHENTMFQTENNNLRTRIKAMQETIDQLTARNTQLLTEKATGNWITPGGEAGDGDMTQMIHGYLKEIEELRTKLLESENTCQILRRSASRAQSRQSTFSPPHPCPSSFDLNVDADDAMSVDELIGEAKLDVVRLKRREKRAKLKTAYESEKDAGPEGEEKDDTKSDDDEVVQLCIDDDMDASSETDSEDKENIKYEEDLAELTCEISLKQKLIEELEKSQRRLQTMRQQYEDKLMQLQNKIRCTQEERDKIMSAFGNVGSQTEDKAKKVKEEYEKKLNNMNNELKKLQEAKKRHAQLVKSQSQYEQQLKTLKSDLAEMKKTKVRLLNKMKEESTKHKESEVRRSREIAQLKKESRVRENQIRSLEAEKRLKESILRRKQDEVAALRKLAKPMSDKVAGRLNPRRAQLAYATKSNFNSKMAKHKWQTVEKEINKLVLNRQAITNLEKDMERWLEERDRLSHNLERFVRKRDRAILDQKGEVAIKDVEDQIENVKANIDYIQENISECQSNIVQMEEPTKDVGNDTLDAAQIMTGLGYEEVKYLLEKLIVLTLNNGILVAQREMNMKGMEAKMEQVIQSNNLHQQLLQHILAQYDLDTYNFLTANGEQDDPASTESSRSSSPMDSSSTATTVGETVNPLEASLSSESLPRRSRSKEKARRRTATTDELLYAGNTVEIPSPVPLLPIGDIKEEEEIGRPAEQQGSGDGSTLGIQRVPSAPGSLKTLAGNTSNGRPSPVMGRKSYDKLTMDISPRLSRKSSFHLGISSLSKPVSVDSSTDTTPPLSPNASRRSTRDDNVFSRLTSRTSINSDSNPDRGIISPYSGKMKSAPLACTHVAEGHSKAVLSVAATEDLLFSASKDRTVKIWDIQTGVELQSLENHPGNVVVVKYSEQNRLAFSVSSSYVKVWDIRENPAKSLKTLSSNGLATNGTLLNNITRSQQITAKEAPINDIALSNSGTSLFSASGNTVRIWDLRKYHCFGKLSGGHQAAVMCLAVDEGKKDSGLVITGSKDHYIKVFEVMEGIGGMHTPKLNLEPPHYDGIESLAVTGQYLFSGSRDMCIKKWDLAKNELKQSLNQAHKDWICGLSLLPSGQVLLSGCRGGYIKLWAVDTCNQLGEIKAHASPINAITTNSSSVFTASSDGTIGLWRMKHHQDSPDMSDAN